MFLNVVSENSDKGNKMNECDVRIGVVNRRRNVEKGLLMFRNEIESNRDCCHELKFYSPRSLNFVLRFAT